MCPVGRHGIGRSDGTEGHRLLIGALIAHHTDTLHGEEHHAGLPNLVVERNLDFALLGSIIGHTGRQKATCFHHVHLDFVVAQAADEDVVGILQHAHLFGRDVAQNAHGQSGAGEGVTIDKVFGHTHLASHAAHFVFEEPLEGFTDFQVHLFRKTAHIVVAFDDLARDVETLDAVRIDGALGEPFGIGDFHGFGVEDVDETCTDDFALLFGLFHSCQFAEELLARIHSDDIQAEAFVVVHHALELILTEHAVVDKDASKAVADGLVEQHGRHR